ncbi:taspase, threonine aspartase, 1 [Phlyctochytrium planicorne]|nr:taspase, threonine aspartase, 1 [Phlyctochytrium planicorne]
MLVVHAGVGEGKRSSERIKRHRAAVADACRAGIKVLRSQNADQYLHLHHDKQHISTHTPSTTLALEAVVAAISSMESSPETNCGKGSNLNLFGKVECDASLMDGRDSGFGGLGSVAGLRNPIQGARLLLLHDLKGTGPIGRVPPVLLSGDGARIWCGDRGAEVCDPDEVITEDSRKTWLSALKALKESAHEETPEDISFMKGPTLGESPTFDTVGAIAIDRFGNVAAGVSSGGILLKSPGRIGHAAIFGSGVWASNPTDDIPGMACSLTGTGEQIIRTMLASKLAESFMNPSQDDTIDMIKTVLDNFTNSPLLRRDIKKSAGFVAMRAKKSSDMDKESGDVSLPTLSRLFDIDICYAHTTETMCLGWMGSHDEQPKTKWSRKDDGALTKIELSSARL